jgi:hypothetical protein
MKIFLAIYWSMFVLVAMFVYGAVSHRTPSPKDHIPDAGKMVEEKQE